MANESFASRIEFLGHEMVMHGLEGRSRIVGPGLNGCVSPFERHVQKNCIACLFCGEVLPEPPEAEYARHVGRHMEEIAFAVVTKPYEDWEFYSDCSGKFNKDFSQALRYPAYCGIGGTSCEVKE